MITFKLYIYNIQNQTQLYTLGGHTGTIKNMIFSSDSRYLTSSGVDGAIALWDMASGNLIYIFYVPDHEKGNYASAIALSPNNKYLAAASPGNSLGGSENHKIWDIASKREFGQFKTEFSMLDSLCYCNKSKCLMYYGDGKIIILDKTGKKIGEFQDQGEQCRQLIYSPNGRYLITYSPHYFNRNMKFKIYTNQAQALMSYNGEKDLAKNSSSCVIA